MNMKKLLLGSITFVSCFAMNHPLIDELANAQHYSDYIEKRYDEQINHTLIEISAIRNPFELLEKARNYYCGSSSALGEYIANFRSNIKKTMVFSNLCWQVWNRRDNEVEVNDLWYSWPLKSVHIDFGKELEIIKKLQETVARADHRSFSISNIARELEEISNNLKRTITIFEQQALLECIKKDPMCTVVYRLTDDKAKEELEKVEYIYSLIDINRDFLKETGQTLCHALCDAKLDSDSFECILKALKNKGGFIHGRNAAKQTVLEYAQSKNIDVNHQAILKRYVSECKKRVWFYDQNE